MSGGIEVEIVEHFLVAWLLLPTGGEEVAAGGGVVGIGEDEFTVGVKAFDVDMAFGANGAHGGEGYGGGFGLKGFWED